MYDHTTFSSTADRLYSASRPFHLLVRQTCEAQSPLTITVTFTDRKNKSLFALNQFAFSFFFILFYLIVTLCCHYRTVKSKINHL